MPSVSQPILFFGTEDFSAVALEGLITAGFAVKAVVTKPDSKKGRGQHMQSPLVKTIAEQNGIPVLQPTNLLDIEPLVTSLHPIAGVLVSYGRIIPQRIIDLFTPGIINLHPSLLPKYRGPSPIESAILNGDKTTGISIMQLSARMDAGPVYHQVEVHLQGDETKPALYASLAELGTSELVAALPRILDGSLQPVSQDETKAVYCSLLSKDTSRLDPTTMSAKQVERSIRAHLGFPRSRLRIFNQDVIVTKAHVATSDETGLRIACTHEQLIIEELIAPSGKLMSGAAFKAGYNK